MTEVPLYSCPDVRCSKTLKEALDIESKIRDSRTASKIVACIDGEISFITPGAFNDHVLHLHQDFDIAWSMVVESVNDARKHGINPIDMLDSTFAKLRATKNTEIVC